MPEDRNRVIVIDYGSSMTQAIARHVREAGIYSEIHPCTVSAEKVRSLKPGALILSGGPDSALEQGALSLDPELLALGVPVLGVCYGMQLLGHALGGDLSASRTREYGVAELRITADCMLWKGLDARKAIRVRMSHGDVIQRPPAGFTVTASAETPAIAAMADEKRRIYALQFHPEANHAAEGAQILRNFLFEVAKLRPDWSMSSFVPEELKRLKEQVGDRHVVCALSGGVDSTVVAVLLHKAIGSRLHCIFVDTGLLRMNEGREVVDCLTGHFHLNLTAVQAQDRFLARLAGVEDPEEKRRIIGHTFIEIFEEEANKLGHIDFLAQGTLYPDVIESVSPKGASAVIKSHHNVGGLPERMRFKLIEPLRELFKDEVRVAGRELGLPDSILWRHPFPGPGLAVRIVGHITAGRLDILRRADKIVQDELQSSGWYNKVWQGFAVLLPLKTVGVRGDARTYEHAIALRVVESVDAMTADWVRLPSEILTRISNRIVNEVRGVNRVVYDISAKPPSTIEWE